MSAAPAPDGGSRRGRGEDRRRELKASVNSAVRLLGSIAATRSWRVAGHFLGYFYRKAVLRTPVPFYISLAVTNRCQGRCVHCYSFLQRHEERPELTTAELESVIDQAARLGIFQVIFTGGEPLLRKDILELIGHARRRGLLTRLNTNSLLLDRDMALALKKAGLGQCALSLDDADPETHDRMRGLPGHHARTLENLSMLRDLGIYALANVYISKRHLAAGPERTIRLALEAGARGIVILPAVASGQWKEEFDQVPDAEGMARIRRSPEPDDRSDGIAHSAERLRYAEKIRALYDRPGRPDAVSVRPLRHRQSQGARARRYVARLQRIGPGR